MNILAIIKPAFTVLKQGQALANPAAWKNAQVLANLLSALIVLLNVFGVHFGLDSDSVNLVAGGIAAIANSYLTAATSEKVGVPDGLPPIDLVSTPTTGDDRLRDIPLPSESDSESDRPTGFNG
jgi:hypothetical protein